MTEIIDIDAQHIQLPRIDTRLKSLGNLFIEPVRIQDTCEAILQRELNQAIHHLIKGIRQVIGKIQPLMIIPFTYFIHKPQQMPEHTVYFLQRR